CRFGDATVTVTPGSASPWLSLTWPEIVPVVLWALERPADRAIANTTSPTFLNPIDSSLRFVACCRSMESLCRPSSQLKRTRHTNVALIQIFVPVSAHLVPNAVANADGFVVVRIFMWAKFTATEAAVRSAELQVRITRKR